MQHDDLCCESGVEGGVVEPSHTKWRLGEPAMHEEDAKKKKSHWCSTHNRIGAGAANWKTRYINVSMYTKSLSCPHYRATKKKKERQSGRPALSLKHFSNSNSSFSPTNCVEAYSYIVLPWLSLFAETSAALILFVLALNAQHYTLETHPFTL